MRLNTTIKYLGAHRILADMWLNSPHRRAELGRWIEKNASKWFREKRSALAVVIEMATFVAWNDKIIPVLIQALEGSETPPLVAFVAAQRARWSKIDDPELRNRIWLALQKRLDGWAKCGDIGHFDSAMPSAIIFGGKNALPWVRQYLEEKNLQLVLATATSVSHCYRDIWMVSENRAKAYAELAPTIFKRLAEPRIKLREFLLFSCVHSALLEALVLLAPPDETDKLVPLVAEAFIGKEVDERCCAYRSAVHLIGQYGDNLWPKLEIAFGEHKIEWQRFRKLVEDRMRDEQKPR